MADFSKYLGNNENVLNAIDMRDLTLWKQTADKSRKYRSWMTLVVTNKRLFMISKNKLKFMEIRHEDIVATGWEYKTNPSELARAVLAFILGFTIIGTYKITQPIIFEGLIPYISALTPEYVLYGVLGIGAFLLLIGIFHIIVYNQLRRTILTVSAKNGKDYKFLLKGKRKKIDDFRLSLQNAKDLSIEEKENNYFTKMNTVLLNQMNYQKALYEKDREEKEEKEKLAKVKQEKLEDKREYIDISANQRNKLIEDSRNENIIELEDFENYKELPGSDEPKMIEGSEQNLIEGKNVKKLPNPEKK